MEDSILDKRVGVGASDINGLVVISVIIKSLLLDKVSVGIEGVGSALLGNGSLVIGISCDKVGDGKRKSLLVVIIGSIILEIGESETKSEYEDISIVSEELNSSLINELNELKTLVVGDMKRSGEDDTVMLSDGKLSLGSISEVTTKIGRLVTRMGKGTIEEVRNGIDSVINSSLLVVRSSKICLLTRFGDTTL